MTSKCLRALLCKKMFFIAVLWLFPISSFAETKMAITVDDLPIHADILSSETRLDVTKKFIEVFKAHHIAEAYGFVNSKKIEDEPETKSSLVAWISAGFPLGNHTYSHMNLNKHPLEDFIQEIRLGEPLLKELVKDDSYKWFRYPFLHEGDTLEKRNAVRATLAKMNYRIAQVSVDFEDWAWNNPFVRCTNNKDKNSLRWLERSYIENAVKRLKYSKAQAKEIFGRDINHILLIHVGTFDSKMLDRLLTTYENLGVKFISLAEAAGDSAYRVDPGLTDKNGNEVLTQLVASKHLPAPNVTPLPFKKLEALCGGRRPPKR